MLKSSIIAVALAVSMVANGARSAGSRNVPTRQPLSIECAPHLRPRERFTRPQVCY